MKTLFEFVQKGEVDRREIGEFNHYFHTIGYRIEVTPKHNLESKSEIIGIQQLTGEKKMILTMNWLRPISWSKLKMIEALNDYPRLTIPKQALQVREEQKVKESIKVMTEWNMYFLVILPGRKVNLYWLDRYDSIPLECWKLNWWGKTGISTRLLLQNFHKYELVMIDDLKLKLDKIFKNEN